MNTACLRVALLFFAMFFCGVGRVEAQSDAPDASPPAIEPTNNRDAGVPPAPAPDVAPPAAPDGGTQPGAPVSEPAPAEAAPEPSAPDTVDDDDSLEVLVVTGSRSERTRVESLVPVDVVSGEALTQ